MAIKMGSGDGPAIDHGKKVIQTILEFRVVPETEI